MAVFVDPKTGERFENDAPDAAERAAEFGFVTPEQYEAEQRSGGVGSRLATAGEEAIRQGAAAASLIPGVDAGAAPVGLTELEPGQAENPLTGVYSEAARERRQVNPTSAGLGAAAPAVAASLLLPGSGLGGLAATIGVDALSGYSQAAVDAELENRDISGSDVLRNAGLNLAFSLPLYGLGEGARIALQGRRMSALERAAGTARDTAGRRAAGAEGADLAQAVADPAVQADLLSRVQANADDAVARASEAMGTVAMPPVKRNPGAQREAVGAMADVFRTTDPELAGRLDELTKGSARARLKGLRVIRDELAQAGESEALDAIDATISREDLWGSKAIRGAADVDSAVGGVPGPGADPEALIEYAQRVRKVRDGELSAMADEIEQLAERQLEIRTASAIGDVAPAANDVVDYAAAMRSIDPNEAWRLTHDGADEGLRRIEAASVSDALQRVDDVLKEDVAMSVKRSDFVKGAESWTPEQIASQSAWSEQMRGTAAALAGKLADAETQGFRIGGFRGEATSLIDRAVQRLADADPVTANFEWDGLKRSLDSLAKRLAASGPAIDDASKAWGTRAILDVSDEMRKGLENADLWGRNAGLQKETNAAWVKLIEPYSRVTKRMAEFLGREFGVVGQAGIMRRFDPDMVESIMKGGYQRNLRSDIDEAIKGLDQMMAARQKQGLSRLDRLSQARADLVRIQQGFDFADLLAVAKGKAKAPIGLEIAGRIADNASPGGIIGSVAGPLAARARGAIVGEMSMLAPGSKSQLAGAVRRHLGMTRGEQAAILADPAFYERLPGSLQKQIMAGSAAGDRAVEMASVAADAAKRDREITARMMVNPEQAKRARKAQRKKPSPALERARKRSSQGGHVVLGNRSSFRDVARRSEQRSGTVGQVSPDEFSIAGLSHDDLGADKFRPGVLDGLRKDKQFAQTGQPSAGGRAAAKDLVLQLDTQGRDIFLVDGSHRLQVGREKGLTHIPGVVRDADGNEVFRGPIRIADEGQGPIAEMQQQLAELPVVELDYASRGLPRDTVDLLDERAQKAWDGLDSAEQAAINSYTGSWYQDIRDIEKGTPRTYADGTPRGGDERFRALAKDLAAAIQKVSIANPTQHGMLYRGIPATADMLDELLTHDEFVTSATTSTSFDPMMAKVFAGSVPPGGVGRGGGKVVMRFKSVDRGAPMFGPMGAREKEVLLPKGQKYRIVGRHRLDDGTLIVDVEKAGKASAEDMRDLGALGAAMVDVPMRGASAAEVASGLAKSPLGVGTGAAGALVAYRHLAEPGQPDPETTSALERFSEGYERPIDAFRAARKMILDWRRNPEALVDMVAGHMGEVGQLSPRLEREMTAQAMRIAAYLQDNLPGQRNVSVVYPDGTPPSRAEVRQFALRFDAAVNPAGVMADARMGRLERTQLDTLYALWPREYDALRAGVIEELGKGTATPQTRQRMSLLFGFGSEVDPALGPRTRAVVAAARATQAEQAPAPSSPGMNRQRLPSTATMQPAGMAALSLGQQIGAP